MSKCAVTNLGYFSAEIVCRLGFKADQSFKVYNVQSIFMVFDKQLCTHRL